VKALAGEPFTATPAQLRAASSAAPPTREDEAQILLDEAIYRIGTDGTLFYQHRLVFRVDTKQSLDDWAEISTRWDPWNEAAPQLRARVLRSSGQFVELDQKTVTDAPVKGEDTETYSSEHERRAPLPGLEVGSIVEQVSSVQEKTPYFSAGSLYRYRFLGSVPIALGRMVVETPVGTPFKDRIIELPKLKVDRSEAAGVRRVVYEQASLLAEHNSDIDLATNEPERAMVEFATGASWAAVAATYAAMSEPQTVVEEAKAILPANLPSDRSGKITAIVAQLHHEVRYTGIEFGAAKLTPERPAQVIARHYGDCKDKATLLVAMLRAAGIGANLALLDTEPGRDVDAELAGMNQFDHAIVYVPAEGKDGAVWIDATAQYFEPGLLPWPDEGRMALVIAPGTAALTETPAAAATDSELLEERTFTLAAHGPAHVVEISKTHGAVDANYRSWYGGEDTKKIHEDLEKYIDGAYLAKKLVKVSHGPTEDLSTPFALTIEADGAKRGDTELDEAEVAIFPNMVLASLPSWFKKAGAKPGPNTTDDEKRDMELAAKSRVASYIYRPFKEERRVKILIPDGYELRALPPNKTTPLGQATMTEEYSQEKNVVLAIYRIDSGPGKLTAEQALAMREAVLELNKRDYVGIYFDQVGAHELAAGHIRAALDADRGLIATQGSEALPHVQLARALLSAGIGDEARLEARRATELEPKLAVAYNTLGWILEHDSLGERFGKGFDRPGAIAAYKKAIELDQEDDNSRFALGILYEFNDRGTRYASDANESDAEKTYRELIERTKDDNPAQANQYRDNMLYTLFYTKQYGELDSMLAKLPFSNGHAVLGIVSATAQHGVSAGVAQAEKGNVSSSDKNKNLVLAGNTLAAVRMYPEAAGLLQAGISGGDEMTARKVEIFKNLKPASMDPLPVNNPARPLQQIMVEELAGTMTRETYIKDMSRHAYSSDASLQIDTDKTIKEVGTLRKIAENSSFSERELLDLIVGSMTYKTTGDDDAGYSVVVSTIFTDASHFYVTRDEDGYRVVSENTDERAVGNAVMYALEHNRLKQAKAILDWERDLTHRAGQDDDLAGPLLPRFWTVGSSKPGADSPEAMRLAAFSLLSGSMDAKPYLAEIAAAREKAIGQRQVDLDLLLASAADGAEQPEIALPAALRLMEEDADSLTAVVRAGTAYDMKHDEAGWLAMLAPRLAKKPTDPDLLRQQMFAYEASGKFADARKTEQAVLDSGKATSSDYNNYAWMGLFDNHVGDAEVKAAQQSNIMSKNASFADLHTLACIYAAEGKTTEARQVLTQAMSAGNETEPNSAVWYALGMIYEQYGARDAALAAYRKVEAHEFDDHTFVGASDTYVLAQERLKALGATAPSMASN